MDRQQKIDFLKDMASGKASAYDLAIGCGFFVQVGDTYIGDDFRFTKEEFTYISIAMQRKGMVPQIIAISDQPMGSMIMTAVDAFKPFTKTGKQ